MQTSPRPVALQVHRPAGLWRSVVLFDAGDEQAEHHMRQAVHHLAQVDELARFRVVTRDTVPLPLLEYSAALGWRPA